MTEPVTSVFGLLTSEQVKAISSKTVVLLPLGSLEPHGHLPLATDSMIVHEILGRVAKAVSVTLLLPTIPLGYLFKYSQWPGAVGLSDSTMRAAVFDIIACLARQGLGKIFVMSGHDENREPALQALREAHLKFGTVGVYCDWLDLGVSLARKISSSRREGHASEIQTSVFQFLFPQIDLTLPQDTANQPSKLYDDDLFVEVETGTWVRSVPEEFGRSFTGNPIHATSEKGRMIVEYIVERARAIIDELGAMDNRLKPL